MNDGDIISTILQSARRTQIPTKAEQLHLGHLIQTGRHPKASQAEQRAARRARKRLVEGNLRLAIHVAKQALHRLPQGSSLDFADLIQEAVLSLHRAAEKYNPALGYCFSTYAMWWCRQGCQRAIANHGRMIRIPKQQQQLLRRWEKRPQGQSYQDFCNDWGYSIETSRHNLALVQQAGACLSLDAAFSHSTGQDLAIVDAVADEQEDPLRELDTQRAIDALRAARPAEFALMERMVATNGPRSTRAVKAAQQSLQAIATVEIRRLVA